MDLARQLDAIEADDRIVRYHIVAHSHGGNVARRALWLMSAPPAKLGAVIYLGTPFLHFDEGRLRYLAGRVHWILLLVLLAALWMSEPFLVRSELTIQTMVFAILAGVVYSLIAYFRFSRESHAKPPGVALAFEGDEALALLQKCAYAGERPELVLRDVFRGSGREFTAPSLSQRERKVPRVRSAPRRDPQAMRRHRRWLASLAGAGRSVQSYWNDQCRDAVERAIGVVRQVPLAGGLLRLAGVVLLFTSFAPYRPVLRPFFASRLLRFRETYFYFLRRLPNDVGIRRYPDESVLRATLYSWPRIGMWLAAVLTAGTYYVLLPIDFLLGVLPWLREVCSRLAIWLGLRSAAHAAFGIDMMGTGFDVSLTGTLPPEISRAAMPDGLEKELADQLAVTGGAVGYHLRSIVTAGDADLLMGAVRRVMDDTTMLHAQYYKTDWIIAAVADAIVNAPATPQYHEYERIRQAARDQVRAAAVELLRMSATVQNAEKTAVDEKQTQ
jgi:hypothetical protein